MPTDLECEHCPYKTKNDVIGKALMQAHQNDHKQNGETS